MKPQLGELLERLYREIDVPARLAADPVAYPHRYESPQDQEVAAVVAASLAYGRVAAFRAVLDRWFAIADRHGGPHAFVRAFDPKEHASELERLYYRWNRGIDFVLFAGALGELYQRHPSLERLLVGPDLPAALASLIEGIRQAAVKRSPAAGVKASSFQGLPRGFRTLLPSPLDGSACKRWWMFLRWMIRPGKEGIDLGAWTAFPPSELVVPLDTHVLRIARFVGLTERTDGSLKTAQEVTSSLRRFDPADPVRFDFALAHLGISGACKGHRDEQVCPSCPLEPVCTASSRV